ncbi:MAG: winged helix-turn-helix domain-containing protein [Omnitrophica bacterium]|nr:winged helix-turn-helix domain-containing protein [Candidatus Omnitrophota bacterium]
MITEIGIVAGEIWHFLDKHGKAELEQLTAGVGRSREIILMSLGWLARKGHVLVEQEGETYKVSLRDTKQTSD